VTGWFTAEVGRDWNGEKDGNLDAIGKPDVIGKPIQNTTNNIIVHVFTSDKLTIWVWRRSSRRSENDG